MRGGKSLQFYWWHAWTRVTAKAGVAGGVREMIGPA
jgi:hypothetical protein